MGGVGKERICGPMMRKRAISDSLFSLPAPSEQIRPRSGFRNSNFCRKWTSVMGWGGKVERKGNAE